MNSRISFTFWERSRWMAEKFGIAVGLVMVGEGGVTVEAKESFDGTVSSRRYKYASLMEMAYDGWAWVLPVIIAKTRGLIKLDGSSISWTDLDPKSVIVNNKEYKIGPRVAV